MKDGKWSCSILPKRGDFIEVQSTSGWLTDYDYNAMPILHMDYTATTGFQVILNVDGHGEIVVYDGKSGSGIQDIDVGKLLKAKRMTADAATLQHVKLKLEGREGDRTVTLNDFRFLSESSSGGNEHNPGTGVIEAMPILLAVLTTSLAVLIIGVRKRRA